MMGLKGETLNYSIIIMHNFHAIFLDKTSALRCQTWHAISLPAKSRFIHWQRYMVNNERGRNSITEVNLIIINQYFLKDNFPTGLSSVTFSYK